MEPSGWPSAIAPPLTFTFSTSGSSSRSHAAITDANASLTSIRSRSSIVMPLRSRIFRVAGIGRSASARDRRRRSSGRRCARGPDAELVGLLARHEEHGGGAVGDLRGVAGRDGPSSLNAGFSAASPSSVVSGRMPWSVVYTSPFTRNGHDLAVEPALVGRARGALLRAQRDLVAVLRARRPTAPRSAPRSAPGGRAGGARAAPAGTASRAPRCSLPLTDSGMWPMCSTPPPIATSWTPLATSAAAKLTACCADPHWRSIVVAGVSIGSPACSQALRPMLYDCSPYCCTQPVITSSTASAGIARAVDHLDAGRAEQLVRVDVLVVALLRDARARPVCGLPRRSRPHDLACCSSRL